MQSVLGYENANVVVTGAASGMGAACAQRLSELGANVYGLDINEISVPVSQAIRVDVMDKASITEAVAQCPDRIFALFNCAGVPCPPTPAFPTMMINFVGFRELTEQLIPRIQAGGGIASVASTAGMAWRSNLDNVETLLATD